MSVRPAEASDLPAVAELAHALWPDAPIEELHRDLAAVLQGRVPGAFPATLLVAEGGGELLGFAEVGLRSHADGCDPSRPCGYLEGWYVAPGRRGQGLGRALVAAAEVWASSQGCVEFASDTWLDAEGSQRAHLACGFEEAERSVLYRKALPAPALPPDGGHYGPTLARLHHQAFGDTAREASEVLRRRLAAAGHDTGRVVELAVGSGILARRLLEAGHEVHGVDLSPDMLALARVEAPGATLVLGSLWSAPLPTCVGVAAVGEAFSYAVDPVAGLAALGRRLEDVHRALVPGGVLLLDVAGPGRGGPEGVRRRFWTLGEVSLGLEEREEGLALVRELTTFAPNGLDFHRARETHRLRLYPPEEVEAALTRAGFAWERLPGYGPRPLPEGWHAWVASRR